MQERDADQVVDLRQYLGILKARKWSIVLTALLVVGSATIASALQTPLYTAKAKLLVEPLSDNTSTDMSGRTSLNTEVELARSEAVAALAKERLQSDASVRALSEDLSVNSITDTSVMEFTYTSPDPQFAAAAANSFADAFVAFREQRRLESLTTERSGIETSITDVSQQLSDLESQLSRGSRGAALTSTLETQRNTLIARLGVLQQQLADLNAQRANEVSGGEIIESAAVPGAPSSPNYPRNIALALFLGLALGVGVAFLRERLDDRFRGRDDIERAIESPVLATIPKHSVARKKPVPSPEEMLLPSRASSEAYRSLRTNLYFLTTQRGIRSVLMTSPSAAEGKTTTAANLGMVLAQAGQRVILVSSDLRRPMLERYFSVNGKLPGLSSWLVGEERAIAELLTDPGVPNLRVVPCGPIPSNPAELLSSHRLTSLIEELEQNCDLVLVDSPPVLAVADASILASRVGGAVLVVDGSVTHRSAAVAAKRELERTGATVIGSVLNSFDPASAPYYYGGYYGSHYADDDKSHNGKPSLLDRITR